MRFINKKMVVVGLLIIEFACCYLMYQSSKKEVDLSKVTYEEEINKNMFAMYVENDEGNYVETIDNRMFPEGYILNLEMTNCIDNKGNSVATDNLIFDNNKMTVQSNKTIFCYLYFDKDKSVYAKVVSDYTNNNGVSKTSSTSAETGNTYDVYYYKGNITNNNILYGGYCWKMVITTETNGVKLIYNGVPGEAEDGTKTCNNTGTASQLASTKAFNSSYSSPAYVGYMYNTLYNVVSTNGTSSRYLTSSTAVLNSQSSMTSSSRKYYFGDLSEGSYSNETYNLENAATYDWSADYSNLVGKYTCLSTTSSSCSTVNYVAAATSSTMYYYAVSGGSTYDAYIKMATEITDNGDGTYTLVNPVEVSKADWYTNYSNYKNYYYCSDLTSDICSDMYYSYDASSTNLSYVYVSKNFKYGNSFTYENGVYKLIDTDVSSIKQFWNWYTNYNTINNNHYTCFNTAGECTSLYYINYTSKSGAYFTTLTGGESVEDAISKMFDDNPEENYYVNTTDSTIKGYIDEWYKEAILNQTDENGVLYSSYLENAIFCNNRTVTNLGGWNPNGGDTDSSYSMHFDYTKLECDDKEDRFTLKTSMGGTDGYGNNALDYPVGLISYEEASLATGTGYLKSENIYWLFSPRSFYNGYALGRYVDSSGNFVSHLVGDSYGVRPSVSLSMSVEITSGDGSVTLPYQLKLSN